MDSPLLDRRAGQLLAEIATHDLDLLLVADRHNLNWLTGFSGSNGACVIGAKQKLFFTDFRYLQQVEQLLRGFRLVEVQGDILGSIGSQFESLGSLKLGYDDRGITVYQRANLERGLPENVTLVGAGGLIEQLRAIKDQLEISAIKRATALADTAFRALAASGIVGRSERELAWILERAMREQGAASMAFPPIVAAAEHAALPHAEPRDVQIPQDTLVVIDWGCMLDGYCSDCTRTVATGRLSDEMRNVYQVVLKAQEAALSSVSAGIDASTVDASARKIIAAAGYGDNFGHGTGHGVGLEVHENPRVAASSKDVLQLGNVVTIEPGIYLPAKFGVRIEDLVIVEQSGREVLTAIDKELTVVS